MRRAGKTANASPIPVRLLKFRKVNSILNATATETQMQPVALVPTVCHGTVTRTSSVPLFQLANTAPQVAVLFAKLVASAYQILPIQCSYVKAH